MPENEVDEILDFASVLIKLVVILLVVLMAGALFVNPARALAATPSMLMLVAPLFVLVLVLDLAGLIQRFSANEVARKSSRH